MMHEDDSIQAFPLQWPEGWKRTKYPREARFSRTKTVQTDHGVRKSRAARGLVDARDKVVQELEKMGAHRIIISSNIPVRNDGMPRASFRRPDDHGVAVYWRFKKSEPRVMACDTFTRVEDNLYAIGKSIEALRGLDRWGTSEIMERAFQGLAIPAPGDLVDDCWEILGIKSDATQMEIEEAYRRKAKETHPDAGGDDESFRRVCDAYEQATRAAMRNH